MDSVFEMVSKGKEIEAIKFLRNEKEISLSKAQQIVKDLKKQIQ